MSNLQHLLGPFFHLQVQTQNLGNIGPPRGKKGQGLKLNIVILDRAIFALAKIEGRRQGVLLSVCLAAT